MPLFIDDPSVEEKPDKTPENAQIIYNSFVIIKNANLVFESLKVYPMNWVVAVEKEGKRMERIAVAYVKENPDCTANQVKTAIASNWLDETVVGLDIISHNPIYKEDRTFQEFKDSQITQE